MTLTLPFFYRSFNFALFVFDHDPQSFSSCFGQVLRQAPLLARL